MVNLVVTGWRCQFCHNTASETTQMIAGDSGFICDECVRRCAELLQKPSAPESRESTDRYLCQKIERHFAPARPEEAVAVSRTYPLRHQADLQAALDELFGERKIPVNFVGLQNDYSHDTVSFSKLLKRKQSAPQAAPAQYEEVDVGHGVTVRCLKNGLWLLSENGTAYAVVLTKSGDYGQTPSLILEVAAPPGDAGISLCSRLFEALERRLSRDSCYRGRVLSLESEYQWSGQASRITVHELEPVAREDIILPEHTLQALERNVLRFAEQRPALRKLGLSTQKGLLFHGPPGTGKTHCIRYLAGKLENHTTFLITAEGVGLLPEYMALARLLQPALVVIEDADLIARERTQSNSPCEEVMLNRLLNELDGLRERADIFFILTTNRPEALEPALANRPGRIDQSIEFPLPDETHRQRLVNLYARELPVSAEICTDLDYRTAGASPAFIKELMRRIAQNYVEAGAGAVTRAMADAALHEMLFAGGALNKALLGGAEVQARDRGAA